VASWLSDRHTFMRGIGSLCIGGGSDTHDDTHDDAARPVAPPVTGVLTAERPGETW